MKIRTNRAKPPLQQRKITEVMKRITQKKRIKIILSVLVLLLITAYFVVGNRGTYKLITFYNQKEKLIEEIQKLEVEKKALETFKSNLENDPQSIEKVAREKYKMKKKGERVYQIVEK
ncbi:MAG: septum formation initiator family protein [Calditrichia bacterium]|nr:septum formation initiator family protein [Calditrichia bacterium]